MRGYLEKTIMFIVLPAPVDAIRAKRKMINSNIHYHPSMLPKRRSHLRTRMKYISFGIGSFFVLMTIPINSNLFRHQFSFNRITVNSATSYQQRSSAVSKGRVSDVEIELPFADCFRARKGVAPKISSTPYINLGFPKMGK